MKKNIIIHIPHASLKTPEFFINKLTIDNKHFNKENIFISDYMVDKLIHSTIPNVIKFKYSRMFCDVERFLNDELESMSKFGMGVIYTKNSNQTNFITISSDYKNKIISNYYLPHHKKIDDITTKLLNKYNKCYFIDLHSYSDEFVLKLFNKSDNPDICIGFDNNYYDKQFIDYSINYFKNNGYSVKTNYPYSGTLIPNVILKNNDKRIKPIMIEINKRIYLDNNKIINKHKFNKLKNDINNYLNNI